MSQQHKDHHTTKAHQKERKWWGCTFTAGENVDWFSFLENAFESSSKKTRNRPSV